MRIAFASLAIAALAAPAAAQDERARVAQFYTYRLSDRPAFEAGYRQHLRWHADKQDKLAWYAWYVTSGERTGLFIDGTFGATLAELDARPDLAGDGADFAKTAAPHAVPLAIETWMLWRAASSATPYEDRRPAAIVDVFRIDIDPVRETAFETAIQRLAANRRARGGAIGWYRLLRGGTMPSYLLLAPRADWAGIAAAGASVPEILARTYGVPLPEARASLASVETIRSETWTYAPRLSLIPGTPLLP